MKIIPNEVNIVRPTLHGESISIEVRDSHGVSINSPQAGRISFLRNVCDLVDLVSAHIHYLT